MQSNQGIFEKFKGRADVREVDTRNKLGYNGYKGKVYKYANLEYFETYNYFRFDNPTSAIKYLYGTTRLSKEEFMSKLTKVI